MQLTKKKINLRLNYSKMDQTNRMNQSGMKQTKMDRIDQSGLNWTEVGILQLKIIKSQ